MKYILKCYCCKEVKHLQHNLKNREYLEQVLLVLIDNDFRFDYKQNAKSYTLSIMVDCESTFKWLIHKIDETLKKVTYIIAQREKN